MIYSNCAIDVSTSSFFMMMLIRRWFNLYGWKLAPGNANRKLVTVIHKSKIVIIMTVDITH